MLRANDIEKLPVINDLNAKQMENFCHNLLSDIACKSEFVKLANEIFFINHFQSATQTEQTLCYWNVYIWQCAPFVVKAISVLVQSVELKSKIMLSECFFPRLSLTFYCF